MFKKTRMMVKALKLALLQARLNSAQASNDPVKVYETFRLLNRTLLRELVYFSLELSQIQVSLFQNLNNVPAQNIDMDTANTMSKKMIKLQLKKQEQERAKYQKLVQNFFVDAKKLILSIRMKLEENQKELDSIEQYFTMLKAYYKIR